MAHLAIHVPGVRPSDKNTYHPAYSGLRSRMFSPGDSVAGTVRLSAPSETHVRSDNIHLRGIIFTEISRNTGSDTSFNDLRHQRRYYVFECHQELFKGPYTVKRGEHQWLFTFTLPVNCLGTPAARVLGGRNVEEPYNVDVSQELPPSMTACDYSASNITYCTIQYALEATLIEDGRLGMPSSLDSQLDQCVIPRSFQTRRDARLFCDRKRLQIISKYLDPLYEKRSLRQRLSFGKGHQSTQPKAEFDVVLRTPDILRAGSMIPLFAGVELDLENSTATELPVVLIKDCKAYLRTRTHVAHMEQTFTGEIREMLRIIDKDIHISFPDLARHGRALAEGIPLSEHTDLTQYFRCSMPRDAAPTFGTFCIARSYRLLVDLELECARVKEKATFVGREIKMFAAVDGNSESGASAAASHSILSLPKNSDKGAADPWEGIPAYSR